MILINKIRSITHYLNYYRSECKSEKTLNLSIRKQNYKKNTAKIQKSL